MALVNLKTEHSGAKNGGGAWCSRREAKESASKVRRSCGKAIVRAAMRGE